MMQSFVKTLQGRYFVSKLRPFIDQLGAELKEIFFISWAIQIFKLKQQELAG